MTLPAARRAPLELYATVNAISAARVAELLALTPAPWAGRGFYACVTCASSDALHRTPKGGFYCHACGQGFSNVDAAAAKRGIEPAAACLALADELGIAVPDAPAPAGGPRRPGSYHPAPRPPRERQEGRQAPAQVPPPRRLAAVVAPPPVAVYAAVLDALTLTDRGAAYLEGRGLPAALCARYGFRSLDDAGAWRALFDTLAASVTRAELAAAGFAYGEGETRPAGTRRLPWGGQAPALLIPYQTRAGLAAVRFRHLDPACGKNDRYRTLGGADPREPFNAAALDGCAGDELHVVEGELNALTLGLYDLRAIGVPGAQRWRPEWTPRLEPAARVVAWFDDDPPRTLPDGRTAPGAGEQARTRFAEAVVAALGGTWARGRLRFATIPRDADGRKRDSNDLHLTGELHDFTARADWRA